MNIISLKLQDKNQLTVNENIPEVPQLVTNYLAIKDKSHKHEGTFFRVSINGKSKPTPSDGIAQLNEVTVEAKTGKIWKQIYSTGMLQYRGAYNWEIDDADLSFSDAVILTENAKSALIAYRTGSGNVKVFSFSSDGSRSEKVAFNWREYEKQQERLKLAGDMLNDSNLFSEYVGRSLKGRWSRNSTHELAEGGITVIMARHASRDFDAATDLYQFFILVKGKGIAVSEVIRTGISNPTSKFSSTSANVKDITLSSLSDTEAVIETEMSARHSYPQGVTFGSCTTDWKQSHRLKISLR